MSGLLFAILTGWVVPVGASPAPEASEAPASRPVVGLVLGGGGAKGIAHIGVLQVLEELRVPVDLVVGTSMGAGVGGLYAQGHTAAELEELVLAVEWQTIFRDEPPRHLRSFRRRADERRFPLQLRMGIDTEQVKFPTGIVQGQRLMPWLRRQALNDPDITHFDQLPLPFRAMVVDLASGETLALEEGDVTLAIRASMGIPGIMSPVVHEGRYLVDGGLSNNLPVDVARSMGAEVVIAVDVSGTPTDVADATDPLDILQLALNVMMLRSGEEQLAHLGPGDVLLQPDVRGVGIDTVDFDRGREAIAAGREAALHLREPLSRYRVSEAEWEAREGSRRVERTRPTPQFYRLENHSRLPDDLIRSAMASRPREGFDLATLERDMERIHGLGYFDHIDYRPVHEDGEDGIVITVEPRGWGPDYLRAGITLEEDFDGKSNYRAVVSYLQTEVGPYGAEWQTDLQVGHAPEFGTQYWQPLRRDARAYVNSHLLFSREDANVYDLGEKVGEYRNSRAVAGLDIGYYWRYWADLRLGIEAGEGQSRARTPAPDLPQRFSFNIGKLISQLTMDSLDDVFFPTSGRYLSLRHDYSLEDLGADTRYRKASGEFLGAFSSGRHTFSAGLKVGTTLAGDLPLHDSFQLGGFTNLSGYQRNELTGAHLFHAQMAYLRRMNTLRGLAGVPIYTGAMLESGQVWDERQGVRVDDLVGSASVVTVVKSAIGAVYMGASRTDDDRDSVYLSVGHPF